MPLADPQLCGYLTLLGEFSGLLNFSIDIKRRRSVLPVEERTARFPRGAI
jgi:hypothetical protein